MRPEVILVGFLTAIVALLFYAALYLWRIARTLDVLEERSRPRTCRVCGCTDEFGCVDELGLSACRWVAEDLCSACAENEAWESTSRGFAVLEGRER